MCLDEGFQIRMNEWTSEHFPIEIYQSAIWCKSWKKLVQICTNSETRNPGICSAYWYTYRIYRWEKVCHRSSIEGTENPHLLLHQIVINCWKKETTLHSHPHSDQYSSICTFISYFTLFLYNKIWTGVCIQKILSVSSFLWLTSNPIPLECMLGIHYYF